MANRNLLPAIVLSLACLVMVCSGYDADARKIAKAKPAAARHRKSHADLRLLKAQKAHIDSLAADTGTLTLLVKEPGKEKPTPVTKKYFPAAVETVYNLYKGPTGKVIYAVEMPTIQSGDWVIIYKSYFDPSGHLFAFVNETRFFNDVCSANNGVIQEILTNYYDDNFHVAGSDYTVLNEKGQSLKDRDCLKKYNFPYKVIPTRDEYLKANHLEP